MRRYKFTGRGNETYRTIAQRELGISGRRLAWECQPTICPHQVVDTLEQLTPGRTAKECAERGTMLVRLGLVDEAMRQFDRGVALEPDNPLAHSFLVIGNDYRRATPAQRIRELKAFATEFVHGEVRFTDLHTNDQDPTRTLRVGYLSGDFFRHSAFNTWFPLLRDHDRAQVHVVGYYTGAIVDDYTWRAREACSEWREVATLDDEQLADLIRGDRIDILVDLSCHTAGHRLSAFARKPAPVQLTGFGFVEGNGLAALDYVWADEILLSSAERAPIGKPFARIPSAFWYEAPADCPTQSALPAAWGNPFTFGCFNKVDKITDEVLGLWREILELTPGSRLLLKDAWYDDDLVRRRLADRLTGLGFNLARVELYGASPHREHMECFDEVDLALDPFPHGGGTSTAEALWMGVPVVTLHGQAPPGRMGTAILARSGLSAFIAESKGDYLLLAAAIASEPGILGELRQSMRARLARSPVFNPKELVIPEIENAYRAMWQDWCSRRARAPIYQRQERRS